MSLAHANNRQIHQTEGGLVAEETNIVVHNPFPTSAEMKKYGDINSDFPSRLIAYAENEQNKRYSLANTSMILEFIRDIFGYVSSIITISLIGWFSYYLIEKGQTLGGLSVIITSVVGVIAVFHKYPPRRR